MKNYLFKYPYRVSYDLIYLSHIEIIIVYGHWVCIPHQPSLQHGPLEPLRVAPVELGQPGHLGQLPLHALGVAVDPLEAVHVGVQDLDKYTQQFELR